MISATTRWATRCCAPRSPSATPGTGSAPALTAFWLPTVPSKPVIARLARLLVVHDLGGNIPGQLAAAGLLPRLEPLSQRRATELKARHDHLRAELAAIFRNRVAVLPGNGLDASAVVPLSCRPLSSSNISLAEPVSRLPVGSSPSRILGSTLSPWR